MRTDSGSALAGETVQWGAETLPAETATTHFLAMGTTGAGKTLLLKMLMQSVLPFIGKKRADGTSFDRRALVYDAKSDVLSTLYGMADCRIVTLHPFDVRGAAWDMGRDIKTPAAALQSASIFVPQERSGTGNPFFVLAAQNLLRGVMLSFLQTVGEDWTFRDVLLALRFEERLRQVLEKTVEGRAILDQFFQTGSETLQGVRATLATKMAPFEAIAASWDTATERVSLTEFMEGEFILVLGNDETTRTALDAINRVLFQRLSEIILTGQESRTRQTWVLMDEIREAGRLDGLSRLMTKGRSKGACVALGFQAIEGMYEVYGQNVADEIVGLCNNKAILRTESPPSAKWGSSLFGKREEIDHRATEACSRSGKGFLPNLCRSRSVSEQRITTNAVLDSEVMSLTPTSPSAGLSGYFITRACGATKATIPWQMIQSLQPKQADRITDFEPRSTNSQYLREWTPEDLTRLGLRPVHLAFSEDTVRNYTPSRNATFGARTLRSIRRMNNLPAEDH